MTLRLVFFNTELFNRAIKRSLFISDYATCSVYTVLYMSSHT